MNITNGFERIVSYYNILQTTLNLIRTLLLLNFSYLLNFVSIICSANSLIYKLLLNLEKDFYFLFLVTNIVLNELEILLFHTHSGLNMLSKKVTSSKGCHI